MASLNSYSWVSLISECCTLAGYQGCIFAFFSNFDENAFDQYPFEVSWFDFNSFGHLFFKLNNLNKI